MNEQTDGPVDSPIDFPELQQGVLDEETVERYFEDLSAAEVFDVLVKGAPEKYASEGQFTLETGRALFEQRAVRGLQIRYRWEGAEWWDTLLHTRGAVRLIRVRQEWDAV